MANFPDLPPEIRLIIWHLVFPSTDGIICNYDWRWQSLIRSAGGFHRHSVAITGCREVNSDLYVRIRAPNTFWINRESRAVAEDWAIREGLAWRHPWGNVKGDNDGDFGGWVQSQAGFAHLRKGYKLPENSRIAEPPVNKVLARAFDANRDYVYIGWERKHGFKHHTLEALDKHIGYCDDTVFHFDEEGAREPFPRSWVGALRYVFQNTMIDMKHLVVPAFTGYYSTNLIVDILRYRQVKKLYILWGELPQPVYGEQPRDGQPEWYETDVQPCWRLEKIEMTEDEDADDEVEMYSYISKAEGRDPCAGDKADLYIDKGSLSEWMEELREQVMEVAEADETWANPALTKYVEGLEIVPVRLVKDGIRGQSPPVGGSYCAFD